MLNAEDVWQPVRLTIELASITTVVLLVVGTPIAWWLARSPARWKEAVAAVVALPLVLPPTVLGFYLLVALGPNGPGGWIAGLFGGRSLAFTFEGLVIGSVIYSMPFVVQPIRNAFEAFGERPLEVAATLRASPRDAFWTVAVPLARRGFLTGAVLGFAHTVGEFGVVLMIGGNIPGETKVHFQFRCSTSAMIFQRSSASPITWSCSTRGALSQPASLATSWLIAGCQSRIAPKPQPFLRPL